VLVRRASEVRTLLGQDVPRAGKILRRLLAGRLQCAAFDDGRQIGYRFKAQGSYTSRLPVALATPDVVTPAGFAGLWSVELIRILRVKAA
jgi:hypothetical protein